MKVTSKSCCIHVEDVVLGVLYSGGDQFAEVDKSIRKYCKVKRMIESVVDSILKDRL